MHGHIMKINKEMESSLKLKISNSLFIINENKINVFLAGRNIKDVEIVSPLGINPHNLMKYNDVVIDSSALESVEKIAS